MYSKCNIWTQKVLYHDSFTIGTDNIIDGLLNWKKSNQMQKKKINTIEHKLHQT